MDMHAFVHEKPLVEERVNNFYRKLNDHAENIDVPMLLEKDKLNVVILGMDSVSRMNFIRFMPKSYDFLKNSLSAIEMRGFNKVGDNTYPNMAAALTSQNKSTLEATCVKDKAFDDCPFIWKKYAATGYRTSYGEDATWMGIFNYLVKGFISPPVDYYLRPFGVAARELIGNHHIGNAKMCYGPRFAFGTLLDYMKTLAFKMGSEKRYFQLIWATSLTHDYFNFPKLGDEQLAETLKWFSDGGYLNKTAFVVMSDHGIRYGAIQRYLQGQIEGRLPMLFYVFPKWFKEKYSRAFRNIKANQDRLTTHFDVFELLYDLHDLNRLTDEALEERERKLEEMDKNINLTILRGISQFLPIPLSRTCQMAEISEHFCSCNSLTEVDKKETEATQAANYIVHHINILVSNYSQCGYLSLGKIENVHLIKPEVRKTNKTKERIGKGYHLTIVTSPGDALFEASVVRVINNNGTGATWNVSGVITRANLYGNQSHCVDKKELKLYCYCIV